MNAFQLLSPQKIVFGWGRRTEIGALAKTLGHRAFVIDGSKTVRKSEIWKEMILNLQEHGITVELIASATREPTVEDVDHAVQHVRSQDVQHGDFLIGLGGGAAIDLAKAVSAMATNHQGASVRDFLEGVGTGATVDFPPLPMLAIPTTSGTGSEATKNAVISVDNPKCKKSLRSDQMVPNIVLIDPELTLSLSQQVTASSGMDAITQLIESYISKRAQPIPQALCVEGLKYALSAMELVLSAPDSREAGEGMSYAALLSGMALANSGLGMAHGVAAALGAHCGISHGLACAVMLPVALNANRQHASNEIGSLVRQLTNNHDLTDPAAFDWLYERITHLNALWSIPANLSDLGVTASQIPELVSGSRGNSMNGNPRELSDEELTNLLKEML